jgi:peptidoglycan/xylan/chitin deacetylase (PgdA/CDA1 family)
MKRFIILVLCCSIQYCFSQEIALTFDDAPMGDGALFSGKERTQKILTQLRELKVKQVAFFVVTSFIDESGKERLQQYADAGHLLANHTHRHQWINVIGTGQYIKDIQHADSVLRLMKGFTPWFRYPFLDEGKTLSTRDSIRASLKALSLSNGYVTIDNYDWYINGLLRSGLQSGKLPDYEKLKAVYIEHIWNSIQFYDQIAKNVLGRSPRHVLLLHENDLTALYIGDLIKYIQSKGWKIISPVEAYKDAIATEVPDVLMNGQGRVAAIAKEKGVAGKDLVQEAEDEAYLDALVKSKNVFK